MSPLLSNSLSESRSRAFRRGHSPGTFSSRIALARAFAILLRFYVRDEKFAGPSARVLRASEINLYFRTSAAGNERAIRFERLRKKSDYIHGLCSSPRSRECACKCARHSARFIHSPRTFLLAFIRKKYRAFPKVKSRFNYEQNRI